MEQPCLVYVLPSLRCCLHALTSSPCGNQEYMLHNINHLYVGMPVLILLDLSYPSRFWVGTFLAAQTPSTMLIAYPNRDASSLVLTKNSR